MSMEFESRMFRLATSVVFSLAFTLAGPAIAASEPEQSNGFMICEEPEVREEWRPIDHRLAAGALRLDLWPFSADQCEQRSPDGSVFHACH